MNIQGTVTGREADVSGLEKYRYYGHLPINYTPEEFKILAERIEESIDIDTFCMGSFRVLIDYALAGNMHFQLLYRWMNSEKLAVFVEAVNRKTHFFYMESIRAIFFKVPYEDLPLFINAGPIVQQVAVWRIKLKR